MKTKEHDTKFQAGETVMLRADNSVNQIVDDPTKDWSLWDKMNYKWVNVKSLVKGCKYINPNTGDTFTFAKHEKTNSKNVFAVDSDGVIHIAQMFKQISHE